MSVVSEAAAALGLRIVTTSSKGGRGPALNAGIREATGDIILTLHADTLLPAGWDRDIKIKLSDPRVLMTAFSFGCDREQLTRPDAPPG